SGRVDGGRGGDSKQRSSAFGYFRPALVRWFEDSSTRQFEVEPLGGGRIGGLEQRQGLDSSRGRRNGQRGVLRNLGIGRHAVGDRGRSAVLRHIGDIDLHTDFRQFYAFAQVLRDADCDQGIRRLYFAFCVLELQVNSFLESGVAFRSQRHRRF